MLLTDLFTARVLPHREQAIITTQYAKEQQIAKDYEVWSSFCGGGSRGSEVAFDHLAGQVLHQGDHGVFEERRGRQRALGDLCDAQLALRPHLLQHLVGAAEAPNRQLPATSPKI